MSSLLVLAGFLVGTTVGATAIGAGLIVVPLLMLLGFRPTEAVGTALAINFATRLIAAVQHHRQKTVHYGWVGRIALGSLPACALVIFLMQAVKTNLSVETLDMVATKVIGAMLVIMSIIGFASEIAIHRRGLKRFSGLKLESGWKGKIASLASGVFVGASVAATGIGAGGIVVAFLATFTSLEPSVVVGTSIVHGVILAMVAMLGHFWVGELNPSATVLFLAGSLPGALLGSWLSVWLPKRALKLTLLAIVLASGVRALI